MEYISVISSVIKIIVFVLVAGAAVFVAYMSHKNQVKEHFTQDMSGISIAFNAVLNREPNQNELDHFNEMSKNGFTRIEFETFLTNLKAYIFKAYNAVSMRDPTESELAESIQTFTTYAYKYEDILSFIKTRLAADVSIDDKAFTIPSTVLEGIDMEHIVTDAFVGILSRDPTPEEIIKYKKMLSDKDLSLDKLKDFLLISGEYKENQVAKAAEQLSKGIKEVDTMYPQEEEKAENLNYDVYVNIISLYQGVLQRNPTQTELDNYYTQVDTKKITLQQLRLILQNSEEYRIFSQNQTNVVNSGLSSDMTDRQSNFLITTQFQKVYDRSPTEGEIKFLEDKIKTYSMNDEKLYDYILRLKHMESFNPKDDIPVDNESDKTPISFGMTPDDYMIDKPVYKGPGSKFKESEIFKIAEKVSKILTGSKSQGYTSYVNQRNTEDKDYMGAKYQTGFQKESELVSDEAKAPPVNQVVPKNNCPPCRVNPLIDQTSLIGTLLNDAKETQVGSILSKFNYQNVD